MQTFTADPSGYLDRFLERTNACIDASQSLLDALRETDRTHHRCMQMAQSTLTASRKELGKLNALLRP